MNTYRSGGAVGSGQPCGCAYKIKSLLGSHVLKKCLIRTLLYKSDWSSLNREGEDNLDSNLAYFTRFIDSSLYDHAPVTYASSGGGDFVYHHPTSDRTFNLVPPDTTPANHRLHASDIWVSSVFLADHIDELGLDKFGRSAHEPLRILELGAGAGLPSIVLAKTREDVRVVVSDYPDPRLIHALEHNVARNELQGRCTAVPHAWGSPPAPLFTAANDAVQHGFDAVLAADTLWNSDTHEALLQTLCATLRRGSGARAHFVAGLHTGRWALSAFVKKAEAAGLALIEAEERAVRADVRRPWKVDRGSEDESERRRWIVWFVLSWAEAKG